MPIDIDPIKRMINRRPFSDMLKKEYEFFSPREEHFNSSTPIIFILSIFFIMTTAFGRTPGVIFRSPVKPMHIGTLCRQFAIKATTTFHKSCSNRIATRCMFFPAITLTNPKRGFVNVFHGDQSSKPDPFYVYKTSSHDEIIHDWLYGGQQYGSNSSA